MVMDEKKTPEEGAKSAIESARISPVRLGPLAPRVCLDFANTLDDRLTGHPHERLNGYADLVSWSQQSGILAKEAARGLAQEAARRPAEAAMALGRAIALREALYRIFSAVAGRRSVRPADLEPLNAVLGEALAALRIVRTAAGFAWGWSGDIGGLDRLLWPIAQSAAGLLTSAELRLVRECAAPSCGWLFLDTSRNHSRRWCDMKACGNRAKARRHYERKKGAEKSTARPEQR
jgi:predicted RNA-binding Zn ribbon-like protein